MSEKSEMHMPRMKSTSELKTKRSPPAMTLEGRDDQLAALAYNLAEERLRAGTASNTLIEKVMQNGSRKYRLELEKLQRENELLVAKVKAIESASRIEELYSEAIKAMRLYSGEITDEDSEDSQNIY